MGRPRPLLLLALNLPHSPPPQSQALRLTSALPYLTPVFPFPPVSPCSSRREKSVHRHRPQLPESLTDQGLERGTSAR